MDFSNFIKKSKRSLFVATATIILTSSFSTSAMADEPVDGGSVVFHGQRLGPRAGNILRVRFPQMFEGGYNRNGEPSAGAMMAIREARRECNSKVDDAVGKCHEAVTVGGGWLGGAFCWAVGGVVGGWAGPLGVGLAEVGCASLGISTGYAAYQKCDEIGAAKKAKDCG